MHHKLAACIEATDEECLAWSKQINKLKKVKRETT
jgi:hypothetical protein